MQNASDLLCSLHRKGVKVWVENERLRFRAPRDTLLPEELARLGALKAEIIELLDQMEFSKDAPLKRRADGCLVPLTAHQLGTWNHFIEEAAGLSVRWSSFAMRVLGPLDVNLLKRSIDAAVWRHESIRTKIVVVEGIPRQQIDVACEYEWDVIDISDVSPKTIEGELKQLAEDFVRVKIDISSGQLFAVRVFRLSNCEHVLILALDHIITDGFSNGVLAKDIWALYRQGEQGLPLLLPELPLQFADYAVWQQRAYGAWLQNHEAYWRGRLTGSPQRIQIPVRDDSWQAKDPVGAELEITFGNALSAKLREIARRERTLLAMVVLTVYAATMSRWCNERNLVIAFISNGRNRSELQGMVGLVADPLFLRLEITKEDNFIDLLRRLIVEFRSAYDHPTFCWVQCCPTDVRFNWLPDHGAKWVKDHYLHGSDNRLVVLPFSLPRPAPLKLIPAFYNSDTGIGANVMYRPDLFALSTVERFGGDLRLFAEEFSRRPLCRVESVFGR